MPLLKRRPFGGAVPNQTFLKSTSGGFRLVKLTAAKTKADNQIRTLWRLRSQGIPSSKRTLWHAEVFLRHFCQGCQLCLLDFSLYQKPSRRRQSAASAAYFQSLSSKSESEQVNIKGIQTNLTHTRFQKNVPSWEDLSLIQGLLGISQE